MNIVDWDPTKGMAPQGDVLLIPVPPSIVVDLADEVMPDNHRLILQEGEITGHHHAIDLHRQDDVADLRRLNLQIERLLSDASDGKIALPSARLYRGLETAEQMRAAEILTRVDLVIGLLIVEIGPMVLTHDEHDGIRIPPGAYLVGRQVESAGAEERVVRD